MFDMKNKRPQVEAVFDAFAAVTQKHAPADRALQFVLRKNKHWSNAERAWTADTLYDFVRWWRLLGTAAGTGTDTEKESLWLLFATWLLRSGKPVPEEKMFARLNQQQVLQRLEKFKKVRALNQSIPDWLDARGEKELGADWDELIASLNKKAPLFIRVNTLRTDIASLAGRLNSEKFKTEACVGSPDALEVKGANIFRSDVFEEGGFEVQDLSSQQVAPMLQVEPGMRVIDACAGTGGKSLHLVALMQNKGRLLALDTVPEKLEELRKRARRAGAGIIETRVLESSKVIKRLHDTADRVLLDVPCSGTGVLRRNPDIRWRLQEEDLDRLLLQQRDLLDRYSSMVKPGGKMVYAVCSIFPSEGEKQVEAFIERTQNKWTLEEERRTTPLQFGGDGFYIARLKREA